MDDNNPSRRDYINKATFIIRIGDGFIVDSTCVRLDTLEHDSPFGNNDPSSWIIDECNRVARTNGDRSASFNFYKISLIMTKLEKVTMTRDELFQLRKDRSDKLIKEHEAVSRRNKERNKNGT